MGQGSTVKNEDIRLVISSLRSPATDKAGPSLSHASQFHKIPEQFKHKFNKILKISMLHKVIDLVF